MKKEIEYLNITLEIDYDIEGGYGDGWHEPRVPKYIIINEIKHYGVDIMELISDEDMESIETALEKGLKNER